MYVWKKIISKFRWNCISVWSLITIFLHIDENFRKDKLMGAAYKSTYKSEAKNSIVLTCTIYKHSFCTMFGSLDNFATKIKVIMFVYPLLIFYVVQSLVF